MLEESKRKINFNQFLGLLYIISLSSIVGLFIYGGSFYFTPLIERPHHLAFRMLKPGGFIGHGYGVIGGLMIIATLLYPIRKRKKRLKKWGKLVNWLEVHIYLGFIGPLFILLHSSFKVGGLVSVAFWSMWTIVISGVVGRYILRQIPRNIKGHKLTLETLQAERNVLKTQLAERWRLTEEQLVSLEALAVSPALKSNHLIYFLIGLIINDIKLHHRIHYWVKVHVGYSQTSAPEIRQICHAIRDEVVLSRRIRYLSSAQKFFKNWHRFHKPFSYILIIIMLIHMGISIWLGYRWIF